MRPFAEAALRQAGATGGTVVLLLDQSKVSARHQMLVPGVRVGERALPLAWRGPGTPGRLRVAPQRGGLTPGAGWPPPGARVLPIGGRLFRRPPPSAPFPPRARGWG